MMSLACYLLLAICYSLSDTCYLKLATFCKNSIPFAPVVRRALVILRVLRIINDNNNEKKTKSYSTQSDG